MMNIAFDKPILTLTDAAALQAKKLMQKGTESAAIGLRVGIKTAGCSGLQYQVEFAQEQKPFEDKIEQKGITIFIDPAAVMFLIGSEMDWQEDKFSSSFTFSNPNETARCGCGESFTVT
jgi:iron-sulfur cluster assembly protein